MENINKIAENLAEGFEVKDFNGTNRTIIKQDIWCKSQLLDLTYEISKKTQLDTDSCYDFASLALDAIANSLSDNDEDIQNALNEIEPDIYTGQLTEWLSKSCNNVYYLGDAISEGRCNSGFEALAQAQKAAIDEVSEIVLQFVKDRHENQ